MRSITRRVQRAAAASFATVALAVAGTGAAAVSANAATVPVVTNFTFPSNTAGFSSVLSVDAGNPVPANGTPVTFDLQQFVSDASVVVEGSSTCHNPAVSDTGSHLAADIQEAIYTLEGGSGRPAVPAICWDSHGNGTVINSGAGVSGPAIPAGDFHNLPIQHVPTTPSNIISSSPFTAIPDEFDLNATHTTITLYVVNATANTFGVSPTAGGAPLFFCNVEAIDPSLQSSVSWDETTTTPPVTSDGPPYVLHGKWTSRTDSTATVSWDNSANDPAWLTGQNFGHGKCNEVYITGYGFGPLGDFADAHVGFTCDNGAGHDVGYLRGLLPDHTYAMRILPATGTYGDHHPIPGAVPGYVDVFTTADF